MSIAIDVLRSYGASDKQFKKGDFIFHQGAFAHFYHQIVEGEVKMISLNPDGKEFVQGIFKNGESFGEPPLLLDRVYPSSGIASTDTVLLRLNKEDFFTILEEQKDIVKTFLISFAGRIYEKTITTQILISHTPEEKIIAFLQRFKEDTRSENPIQIPYTRQQIADFTGIRVETVIRTLTKLNKENKVTIVDHKVYY